MNEPEAKCDVCDQWSAAEWCEGAFGGPRWSWLGGSNCPNCDSAIMPTQLRNLVQVTVTLDARPTMPMRCPECESVSHVRIEDYQKLAEAERTFGARAAEFQLGMTCDCGFFGGTMSWAIVRVAEDNG